MQELPTCFAMYTALVAKFKTSSRAAQMNIFYKLRNFRLDPDGHNAGVASVLRDLHAEWMAVNVVFGINAYLGFVLQAAVMDLGAAYKTAFELRVEQLVQEDKKGRCPTFEAIMTALDICKDQHKHAVDAAANAGSSFTSPNLRWAAKLNYTKLHKSTQVKTAKKARWVLAAHRCPNPPTALQTSAAETDHFDVSAFLADVDKSKWVDALDFYALTAHKCWQCGGKNHYAKNCPDRAQPGQPDRRVGHPIGTIVGTIYGRLPSGVSLDSGRFPPTSLPPLEKSSPCARPCGSLPAKVSVQRLTRQSTKPPDQLHNGSSRQWGGNSPHR
ncbi:hypothetical protein PTTG_30360 [Puccinia triticina 1-1 BBBD Race 1]|uniref:CCHC-type domain-containing protein n=1 Tax=Puccinia triticina (isolate 1-1 / race 1 (BBBD)) TaxID=630390 RepID=A0A180FZT1_PUCT1|nr:hypothetical protein PTTG_30360 [Puccinia triticina 1-1 BBBD Race 1]